MIKTLGIDYGRSKMGLALGVGSFAEPMKVIRYTDSKALALDIKKIVEEEKIEKIIVGVSEGEMAEECKKFATELGIFFKIPTETFDETLTSKDAQKLSIEAGIGPKRRHQMEDAYAATLMLQNYLDSINP